MSKWINLRLSSFNTSQLTAGKFYTVEIYAVFNEGGFTGNVPLLSASGIWNNTTINNNNYYSMLTGGSYYGSEASLVTMTLAGTNSLTMGINYDFSSFALAANLRVKIIEY